MSEFTPIETQEAFDAAIKSRIERERAKFSDYDAVKAKLAEYEEQISGFKAAQEASAQSVADLQKTIAERDTQIKGYETASVKTTIALQTGLPYEMASRLTGETEDEIRADAEKLSAMFKTSTTPSVPLRNQDANSEEDGVLAAFKKMNPNIKF